MKVQILHSRNMSDHFKELGYSDDAFFDVRNHLINEGGIRLYFIHVPGCGRNGKAPEQKHPTILWTSPSATPIYTDVNPYGYSDYIVKDHIYVEERQCILVAPVSNIQAKSLLSKE